MQVFLPQMNISIIHNTTRPPRYYKFSALQYEKASIIKSLLGTANYPESLTMEVCEEGDDDTVDERDHVGLGLGRSVVSRHMPIQPRPSAETSGPAIPPHWRGSHCSLLELVTCAHLA
jgi:hypothetical protein